jgi:hypothetical protein
MDLKEVKIILSRYYEGLTTEEEESALAEYFAGDDVAEELYIDREWFRHSGDIKVPEPGEDFSVRLSAVAKPDNSFSYRKSIRVIRYSRIAATIALLISGYLIAQNIFSKPAYMKDTYSDPQMAMAEVQRVLAEVSLNMKKGAEGLPELRKLGEAPAALTTFKSASRTAAKSIEALDLKVKASETEVKK